MPHPVLPVAIISGTCPTLFSVLVACKMSDRTLEDFCRAVCWSAGGNGRPSESRLPHKWETVEAAFLEALRTVGSEFAHNPKGDWRDIIAEADRLLGNAPDSLAVQPLKVEITS